MKWQEKVNFNQLNNLKSQFDQWLENFDIKKYPELKKLISDIQDEIDLLFMISEERNEIRISNREILNKKIKEENKIWAKNAVPNHICSNPLEFLSKLEKIWITIDDKWWFHAWKLKKWTYIKDFIQATFQAKELIKSDHYIQIRKELEFNANSFISKLKETLEDTKSSVENFFQMYDNISQLLLKLWIQAQTRTYDLFSKWIWTHREKSDLGKHKDIEKEIPSFKKIGYIFKYLQDNKIVLQSRHILKYPDWSLCIYIQSKNISILVSDEIWSNKCFRDATYIVKWPILEDKPITKDMIGEYEGRRIMFSDTRWNRIEEILDQNPDSREQIKTQNWLHDEVEIMRELITDKQEFINIIKVNFDMESFDSASYTSFVNKYNYDNANQFLLRTTLSSNYALLWLPRNPWVLVIKNAIRWISSNSEKDNKANFMWNDNIKDQLNKLRNYSDFDPTKDLWNTAYGYRLLNLLKIAFDNQDSAIVKSFPTQERKQKLLELTGIDFPLTAPTLSTRLGWISCSTKEYQTLLRKRFCLSGDQKENSQEYTDICLQIQESETQFLWISWLHSKSSKKPEDFSQKVNDDISTAFEIPKPVKGLQKKEKIETQLTIDDVEKFKTYLWKIEDSKWDNMYIRLDNSQIIGSAFNRKEQYKIWDEVEVIISDIKTSFKSWTKYPCLIIKKYEWQEKALKFCDNKTFAANSLVIGSHYTWVVNNITDTKVRVSLSKNCSGFMYRNEIVNIDQLKVGSKIRVKFTRMNGEIPMFKFV